MLALVLSDIHGRTAFLEKILGLIHNKPVEIAFILGDLTNLGGERETEEVLALLKGFKVLAIPGNFDTGKVLETLEGKGVSLHGKKKKIEKFSFVGFGGGLVGNPGGFLFTEGEIENSLESLLKGEKNAVLLTHLPPFGAKIDLAGSGTHIGSKAVRKSLEKMQPRLHLCGHCHEGFGEEKIGEITSINVGAVKEGKALLLEIGDELKWERIQA